MAMSRSRVLRRRTAAWVELYPLSLGSSANVSRFAGWKPGFALFRFVTVRTNTPAPASNTSASAICRATSVLLTRCREEDAVAQPCSLSAGRRLILLALFIYLLHD